MPLDSIPGLLETGLQVCMILKTNKQKKTPKYSCRIIEQISQPERWSTDGKTSVHLYLNVRRERPMLWGQTATNSPSAIGFAQLESRCPSGLMAGMIHPPSRGLISMGSAPIWAPPHSHPGEASISPAPACTRGSRDSGKMRQRRRMAWSLWQYEAPGNKTQTRCAVRAPGAEGSSWGWTRQGRPVRASPTGDLAEFSPSGSQPETEIWPPPARLSAAFPQSGKAPGGRWELLGPAHPSPRAATETLDRIRPHSLPGAVGGIHHSQASPGAISGCTNKQRGLALNPDSAWFYVGTLLSSGIWEWTKQTHFCSQGAYSLRSMSHWDQTILTMNYQNWPDLHFLSASLVAQLVKNPSAMREIWLPSLGWEDPLEKGKATHSSILAWKTAWTV